MTGILQQTKLTPKQELFCRLFTSDKECFGNATQAYIKAYNVDLSQKGAYQTAKANASRLTTNDNLSGRIEELLDSGPLNQSVVDAKLSYWIMQNDNPAVSLQAIREYNRLRGRIIEKRENKNAFLNVVEYVYRQADEIGKEKQDEEARLKVKQAIADSKEVTEKTKEILYPRQESNLQIPS